MDQMFDVYIIINQLSKLVNYKKKKKQKRVNHTKVLAKKLKKKNFFICSEQKKKKINLLREEIKSFKIF